jgi:tellurite resistance protein TerA
VAASAVLVANERVRSDAELVFHGRPRHASRAVLHEGPGHADKPDTAIEAVFVDTAGLPPDVDRVVIAASVYDGSFSQVADLYLQVLDARSETVLARFDAEQPPYPLPPTGMPSGWRDPRRNPR